MNNFSAVMSFKKTPKNNTKWSFFVAKCKFEKKETSHSIVFLGVCILKAEVFKLNLNLLVVNYFSTNIVNLWLGIVEVSSFIICYLRFSLRGFISVSIPCDSEQCIPLSNLSMRHVFKTDRINAPGNFSYKLLLK